jgi:cell wall-associated NlpC family hydrolase
LAGFDFNYFSGRNESKLDFYWDEMLTRYTAFKSKGNLWAQPDGKIKYSAKQDKTADGMRAVSDPQPIATLPEIPGVLVFMPGHVGVYIGCGRVIEAYGFKRVEERPISAQRWTSWGQTRTSSRRYRCLSRSLGL